MIDQHIERMIGLCEEAYNETFDWESDHRRLTRGNWALLAFNSLLFLWNVSLLIRSLSLISVALAFLALGLVAFSVWMLDRARVHHAWILDCRSGWEADLRHWQAVKLEWDTTAIYPEWASDIPSLKVDDK